MAKPTYWLRRDHESGGWRLGLIGWSARTRDTVCNDRSLAADLAWKLSVATGLPVVGAFIPPRY